MIVDANNFTLETLADIRAGYPFRGSIEPVREGSVRVVQMRDVTPAGLIDWKNVVRTEVAGRRTPAWLASGDLLLVARGNRYYAVCIDHAPDLAVCGPHLFHLKIKPGTAVLPEFLAWQLNQPPLQRALGKAAQGSSQLSISRTELEALPISIPPLANQENIVGLVRLALRERDLFASLIRNRERQLETLATTLSTSAARREPRP